jgi:hypothetical protein
VRELGTRKRGKGGIGEEAWVSKLYITLIFLSGMHGLWRKMTLGDIAGEAWPKWTTREKDVVNVEFGRG